MNNVLEDKNANRSQISLANVGSQFLPSKYEKTVIRLKLIKELRFIVMVPLILLACRNFVHLQKAVS